MLVTDVIICEDVRIEAGNKTSLMGMFGNEINIQLSPDHEEGKPIPLRIGVCFKIQHEENEEMLPNAIIFEFRLDEEAKFAGKLPFKPLPENKLTVVRILPQVIPVTHSCKISPYIALLKDDEVLYTHQMPYDTFVKLHRPEKE